MESKNSNIDYLGLLQSSIDLNLENYILKFNDCNEKFCELAVHDIRVRIRRFLTLLSMLKTISNSETTLLIVPLLKDQLKIFNPLRDVQVQLLKVQTLVYTYPVLYKFYHYLLEKEEGLISIIQQQIREFDIVSFNKLILKLKLELDKFYKENQNIVLRPQDYAYQRYNMVVTKFNQSNRADVKSIHKVRLNFKKFRYSMEIIKPIIQEKSPEEMISPENDLYFKMNEFQTVMGNIQDLTIFIRDLYTYAEFQNVVSKEMFKPVEKELIIEREKQIDDFYSNFEKFYSFWKPEYLI
ncbi:CHAD domain-containing protein [Bacteroidetes/Chlorobi group bacterium ChocPot_Mid]|nr:MAG: CHAD domain-containing protein [Bacteroidetes/Chlorobi group bacterium ChocPot_Mid]